jgi:3-methyl-2-oxobutanoate hydroxymethyltransferase
MDLERLTRLKREGKKIVAVVAWDAQMAAIAERAGVDLVSVGDSVGVNLWGQKEGEVTLDEMLVVCRAVRRGAKKTLVSCDVPPVASPDSAVRLAKEGGADLVKLLASPKVVERIVKLGVQVFAEFHGGKDTPEKLAAHAKRLEAAGAAMLDFRHSGPEAGAAVAKAVKIPVIGGLGGGPWLDGRVRRLDALIGKSVEQVALEALHAYTEDVRNGRPLGSDRA